MKKFLSIFALACLLALGMALPAAAEGEEPLTELFAQFEDSDEYVKELTIPADLSKEVFFFTKEGDTPKPVTSIPVAVNSSVVEITEKPNVSPLIVTGKAAGVTEVALRDSEGNPISDTVTINVLESHLEIKRRSDTSWSTSLSGIQVNESVDVELRLGANDDFETWTTNTTASEGLTRRGEKIVAETAGTKYLTYNQYRVSIEVSGNEIQIPSDQDKLAAFLSALNNQEEFDRLIDGKYYGGDLTFTLPAEELGSVVCSVHLANGDAIHLKGISGTKMKDLTVHDGNLRVECIEFTGTNSIQLHNVKRCEVKNCYFNDIPFNIHTGADGYGPVLKLTANGYDATDFAKIFDNQGKQMGVWRVTRNNEPEDAEWNLGHYEWYKTGGQVQAVSFDVDSTVNPLIKKGWKIDFRYPCTLASAYTTRDGVVYGGDFEPNSDLKTYVVSISQDGKYAIISGTYPSFSDGKVELTAWDAEYLNTVIVDIPYSDAIVKLNNTTVLSGVDNKKLTFSVKGPGTYKVTATTTSTGSSGSSVQKRTYKYTYQDFYQVTPAGFTNAMRYVKDNLVTLNCTEAGSRSISLPVASMAAAAEKGYSVLVKTKNAELTLDAAALKSIAQQAKGTTVLLHYKSLNHKTLTTVGQASIQSHLAQFPGDNADLAFLVTATSDSETIEDLQMGTITLRIPFILLPGTEGMANTVYALQSESIAEARETTVADGHLTTKLLDLTEHMVFQVGEPAQTTEETTVETTQPETLPETTAPTEPAETAKKGGGLVRGLIAGLSVVLVIICGVLGFVFLRKRFRK